MYNASILNKKVLKYFTANDKQSLIMGKCVVGSLLITFCYMMFAFIPLDKPHDMLNISIKSTRNKNTPNTATGIKNTNITNIYHDSNSNFVNYSVAKSMKDILINVGIDSRILTNDSYSSCSDDLLSPIWSDPTHINESFVLLWHSRVPKTASDSTKTRFVSFGNISQEFYNNNGKINTWLHWKGIWPRHTYLGLDHYQRFAGNPPSLEMSDYKMWLNKFFKMYWSMLNDSNDISKIIQNVDNIDIVYNSHAHMLLIDDFDTLNQQWTQFITKKYKKLQKKFKETDRYGEQDIEYQFVSQLMPFVKNRFSQDYIGNVTVNFDFSLMMTKWQLRVKWMIFLRDPVAHQISRFDWFRHLDKTLTNQNYSHIINFTFDQCVDKLDWPKYQIMFDSVTGKQNKNANYINPCFLSINYFTRWLCGISNVCQYNILNSTNALRKAIDNLNTIYDFVGLVEYYDQSWNYLTKKFSQTLYPDIIPSKLYVSNIKQNEAGSAQSKNIYNKTVPLESSVVKLRQIGYLDELLYKYVKARFETCILPNI